MTWESMTRWANVVVEREISFRMYVERNILVCFNMGGFCGVGRWGEGDLLICKGTGFNNLFKEGDEWGMSRLLGVNC